MKPTDTRHLVMPTVAAGVLMAAYLLMRPYGDSTEASIGVRGWLAGIGSGVPRNAKRGRALRIGGRESARGAAPVGSIDWPC